MARAAISQSPATGAPRSADQTAYIWVVLAVSLLVQTTASFSNQMVSPLAPFLASDLGLTRSQVGLVLTAYYLAGILVMTAAGAASDRLGVRRMFLFGLIGTGLPLLLGAQAQGLLPLMGALFLAGLGNAVALPSTTRAIVDWFPNRHRGLAMGVKQTGVALAGAIMGPTIPVLAAILGWRGAIDTVAWFTVGAGIAAWLIYREMPGRQGGPSGGRPPGVGLKKLLANRNLMLLSATSTCLAALQLSTIGFMVLFLRERLNYDLIYAGELLAITSVAGVVGRIGWGLVSDAFFGGQRKTEMMIIAIGASLSAFGLALISPSVPEWVLWTLLATTGLTAVGWNGINMIFVAEVAGRASSATAAGLNLTFSYIGIMFGPPLFGLLVDAAGGTYTSAFLAGGCLGLVGLLLISQIRVDRPNPAISPSPIARSG